MLQDDINFNYSIIINIIYINSKLILHIINKATHFNTIY
jgi:hypothetical protein